MTADKFCPRWQECSVNDCPLTHGFSADKNDIEQICPLTRAELKGVEEKTKEDDQPHPSLTKDQRAAVNILVRKECCNFSGGDCLLLDNGYRHNCPQVLSSELTCSWFIEAVLPLDSVLEARIFPKEGKLKQCAECGKKFVPTGRRSKYCKSCAKKIHRKQKAESKRKLGSKATFMSKKPASVDITKSRNLKGEGKCLTLKKSEISVFANRGEA